MNYSKRIYLDYNSTAPLLQEAVDAMQPYLRNLFGNPSSVHEEGRHARNGIEDARSKIAQRLGVRRDQIIFTSGGSESINLCIKGAAFAFRQKGDHLITSSVEHSAGYQSCLYLAQKFGFSLSVIPVDETGMINLDELKKAIRPQTILISVVHAQNEVGTIQPVSEIIKSAHESGILVHIDGVQAVGKIPLNLSELDVDLYSFSSHKIGGPKGVGAVFIRDGLKIDSLIHGGHHERDLRSGTENVPGIVGFGAAADKHLLAIEHRNQETLILKKRLMEGFKNGINLCSFNGHPNESLVNTLSVTFKGVDGLALLVSLDLEGISVSSGSACLSGGIEPSRILIAMGMKSAEANNTLRFSLGSEHSLEEINRVVETVTNSIERLRR